MTTVQQLVPELFRGTDAGMSAEPVDLRELRADGRAGVSAHFLYGPEQTGPDGPSAAIVRYAPGAAAPPHEHTGYEIIQVIDGELRTEHGSYPSGSVLVMSPGSVHAPASLTGCTMLVVWERPVRPVD